MIEIENRAGLGEDEFAPLAAALAAHATLGRALEWAAAGPPGDFRTPTVAAVVTQDEFTHDVVVPYRDVFLVYDTT